jgi:hypothetical protein
MKWLRGWRQRVITGSLGCRKKVYAKSWNSKPWGCPHFSEPSQGSNRVSCGLGKMLQFHSHPGSQWSHSCVRRSQGGRRAGVLRGRPVLTAGARPANQAGFDWSIWLQRNDQVFRQSSLDPSAVATAALNLLSLWARASLIDWSQLVPRKNNSAKFLWNFRNFAFTGGAWKKTMSAKFSQPNLAIPPRRAPELPIPAHPRRTARHNSQFVPNPLFTSPNH